MKKITILLKKKMHLHFLLHLWKEWSCKKIDITISFNFSLNSSFSVFHQIRKTHFVTPFPITWHTLYIHKKCFLAEVSECFRESSYRTKNSSEKEFPSNSLSLHERGGLERTKSREFQTLCFAVHPLCYLDPRAYPPRLSRAHKRIAGRDRGSGCARSFFAWPCTKRQR